MSLLALASQHQQYFIMLFHSIFINILPSSDQLSMEGSAAFKDKIQHNIQYNTLKKHLLYKECFVCL